MNFSDDIDLSGCDWAVLALSFVYLVLAVAGAAALCYVVAGGDLARWLRDGGVGMDALVMLGLVQIGLGLALAIAHVRHPLPMFVHMFLPSLSVAAGLGMGAFAVSAAFDVAAPVATDMQLPMLSASLSLSQPVRSLAWLLAGVGFGALPTVALVGLMVRTHDADEPPTVEPLFVSCIVGALLLGVGVGLGLYRGGAQFDTWHLGVLLGAGILALAPVIAATPWFVAFGRTTSPRLRALAWESIALATVGAVGLIVCTAIALDHARQREALILLASSTVDGAGRAFGMLSQASVASATAVPIFVVAACLPGALAFVLSLSGARPWLLSYGAWAMAAGAMVVSLGAVHVLLRYETKASIDVWNRSVWLPIPQSLAVPSSQTGVVRGVDEIAAYLLIEGSKATVGFGNGSEVVAISRVADKLSAHLAAAVDAADAARDGLACDDAEQTARAASVGQRLPIVIAAHGEEPAADVFEIASKVAAQTRHPVALLTEAALPEDEGMQQADPSRLEVAGHLHWRAAARPRLLEIAPEPPASDTSVSASSLAGVLRVGHGDVVVTMQGKVISAVLLRSNCAPAVGPPDADFVAQQLTANRRILGQTMAIQHDQEALLADVVATLDALRKVYGARVVRWFAPTPTFSATASAMPQG